MIKKKRAVAVKPRRRKRGGFVAHKLTADEYLMGHWTKRSLWKSEGAGHHAMRFRFISDAVSGENLLDCGCAFGHSTARLAKMHPARWDGAEFSRHGVERARELFPEIVFYYCEGPADLAMLGPYDSVVMSEFLEHVEDDRAMVEAAMSIAPRLVVTTPCRNVGDPGHRRLYTEESLKKLFRGYSALIRKQDRFFFAVVTRKHRPIVKVVGDSHAYYTFRNMPGVIGQHIGPVTLKRVGYKEDDVVRKAVGRLSPSPQDTFLFMFGEIDVRSFVKPWHERRKEKTTVDAILGEWAQLYAAAIADLDLNGAKRGIIGVIPPASEKLINAKAYPVRGSDEERVGYTRTLNRRLESECAVRQWPFVDVYGLYAGADGLLPPGATVRETHIKDGSRVLARFRQMGIV